MGRMGDGGMVIQMFLRNFMQSRLVDRGSVGRVSILRDRIRLLVWRRVLIRMFLRTFMQGRLEGLDDVFTV
jgi:hypothetical protein